MQTHANFSGIFGCFLQGYNLHRNTDDALATEGCRGCSFLKTSHFIDKTQNITVDKHVFCTLRTADLLYSLLPLAGELYVCLCVYIHAYMCMFKWCALLTRIVCVNVHAEAQRYSFGHRYELCMDRDFENLFLSQCQL